MKIIVSPAKKMKEASFTFSKPTVPLFIDRANSNRELLKSFSVDELMRIYECSSKIALNAYDLLRSKELNEALLTYDGIQYTYLKANALDREELDYLGNNLYILSALYGILRSTDLISYYRLEMNNKLYIDDKNLYDYWGDDPYKVLFKDNDIVINLASVEYSKMISKHLKEGDRFITVYFYEQEKGKLIEKGVYAKMARGSMVRFMAQNKIDSIEKIKDFDELGYKFSEELSSNDSLVFIRAIKK